MSGAEELAAASVRAMHAADVASRALGITVVDVAPERVVVRMTVTDTMVNGHGIGHGGYLFLLADTAFAFACNTSGIRAVAAGASVEFLRPVRAGDVLEARARRRSGPGRGGVYDVTVRRLAPSADDQASPADDQASPADDQDDVVAEFRGRSRAIGGSLLD